MARENSNLVTLRVAQITDIEIRSIGIAKPWRAVIAAACQQGRGVPVLDWRGESGGLRRSNAPDNSIEEIMDAEALDRQPD